MNSIKKENITIAPEKESYYHNSKLKIKNPQIQHNHIFKSKKNQTLQESKNNKQNNLKISSLHYQSPHNKIYFQDIKMFQHKIYKKFWTEFNISYSNEYFIGLAGDPFWSFDENTSEEKWVLSFKEKSIMDPRKKRSVLHLYNMVLCATGCNPIIYKGYGCYCGFLGSGLAVDGIDSCCQKHDHCYNTAGCPTFLEYFVPYFWKCYINQPICVTDQKTYGLKPSCAQQLCECDKKLALCLRHYPCPSGKALCTTSPWRLLQNILIL